jgi:RNA polymerase sigma factor (sigma-70 family)
MPRAKPLQVPTPGHWQTVTENERLVFFVSRRYFRGDSNDRIRDELEAVGLDALIDAAKGFKPERGFRFSSYACRSILSRMRRHWRKLHRFPILCDGSALAGWRGKYRDAEAVDTADSIDRMNRCLSGIDDRLRQILVLRSQGKTLDEVGALFGLSKERVRQLQNRGLELMRARMKAA